MLENGEEMEIMQFGRFLAFLERLIGKTLDAE